MFLISVCQKNDNMVTKNCVNGLPGVSWRNTNVIQDRRLIRAPQSFAYNTDIKGGVLLRKVYIPTIVYLYYERHYHEFETSRS